MKKYENKISTKAKICDAILEKFRGNKTFVWNDNGRFKDIVDIHSEEFYKSINPNFFVIENHLNLLIHDEAIEHDTFHDLIKLTSKGIHIISDIDEEGYVAKERKAPN